MIDLLLPRTDAGAGVQAAVAFALFVLALVAVRRNPDLRMFVLGVGTITAAWFALRTVH